MSLSRRQLLGLTVTSATGLAGCAVGDTSGARGASSSDAVGCLARSDLDRLPSIDSKPLVYELSRRRSGFWFDIGFHD